MLAQGSYCFPKPIHNHEDYDMTTQDQAGSGQNTAKRPLPTAEEVRALLAYDPATGIFRWRKSNSHGVRTGDVAGCREPRGYICIGIAGRCYRGHRLALLHVTGAWPAAGVDHVDGDPGNNRLANLREATQAENNQNFAKWKRPTSSKYLGVYWDKAKNRWAAMIGHNGKMHYLGRFSTEQEAYAAYLAAKARLHLANPIPRDNAYDNRDAAQ